MTVPEYDDDNVHPDSAHPGAGRGPDHTPRPTAMVLAGLSAGFGIIGVSIGFATVLGVTATASGGFDTSGFGPMIISAVSSLVLGLLLIVGAVLLWRAHRASLVVISSAVTLLALSSAARMVLDSLTFVSVVGTVFSLLALVAMGYLITSDDVREHIREGVPLRLR
ncbi:hypothetical protein [Dietzia aurantiaca]|uniref:Uncharacterized protein n=1 Tax=Dietzia aurantiaca TaxID=983873 RepID=A0ABV9PL51_9ACTN